MASSWAKNNPEKKKLIDRRYKLKKYGITIEEYNSMLERQKNKCAIPDCGATSPGGRGYWHLDHCHNTGRIRGILCHNCNVALGYIEDNILRLNGMIKYLEDGGAVLS